MNKFNILFPGGKSKALTLSYDDGIEQDIRLVGMLNRYGIKCTFNLNSSKVLNPAAYVRNSVEVKNIPAEKIAETYAGHEIATHGYSHPWFTKIPEKAVYDEISVDRLELEKITGGLVRGHAYPFGAYDGRTIRQLENNFIAYARTVVSTGGFGFPRSFLEWHPTCHHNDPKLFELLDMFSNPMFEGALFYLWGHSYEFDTDKNWERIEQFCEKAACKDDVWYATNIEICDYIQAYYSLKFSADGNIIYNPSALEIYFKANDKVYAVKSGETISVK